MFDSIWLRRSLRLLFVATSIAPVLAAAGCGDADFGDPLASGAIANRQQALARDVDSGEVVYPDVSTTDDSARVCKHVTVKGKMLYNDQRKYGRFQLREDSSGNPGVQYRKHTSFVYDDGRADNLLGLLDGKVSIYEIDGASHGVGCSESDFQGSTTIAADGSWSWTGDVCDDCATDDLSESSSSNAVGVSIAVKVSLQYCPADHSRCFEVENPGAFIDPPPAFDDHGSGATTYAVWMSGAGLASPRRVYTSSTVPVDVGQGTFQTIVHDPTDLWAQAANVFASIVDATRAVHTERGIAFKYDAYGDLEVIFPSNFDYAASHSHESGKVCIVGPGSVLEYSNGDKEVLGAYATEWGDGDTPMHEYGHIVNYRAWDGHGKWVDYGYAGASNEQDATEYYAAAFKENFADFIKRVTMDDVSSSVTLDRKGCSSFDSDVGGALAVCAPGVPCSTADRNPDVVEHALCDLYDVGTDSADADGTSWGHDDLFDGDLQTVVDALKAAWNRNATARTAYINGTANPSVGVKDNGLRLCSLATAWADSHVTRAWALDEALLHNGLDCGIATGFVGITEGVQSSATLAP